MDQLNKLDSQEDPRSFPGKRDAGGFNNYSNNPNPMPLGSGSGPKSPYACGDGLRPSFHPADCSQASRCHRPPLFSGGRGDHFTSWRNQSRNEFAHASSHPRPNLVQYSNHGNYYESAPHSGNDCQMYPGQYQQYPPVNPSAPRVKNVPVKPVVSYNRQPPPVCLGGKPIQAAPFNTIHYDNYGYGIHYSQYNYSGNTQGDAYQNWYYQQQYQQHYQQQYYQQQPPLPLQPPPPPPEEPVSPPVAVKNQENQVVDLTDDDPEKTSKEGQELSETVKEITESTQDATKKLPDVLPSISKPEKNVDLDGLPSIPSTQSHYTSREIVYKGTAGMNSKNMKVEEEAYDKMFKRLKETVKPASTVQVFSHCSEENWESLSKGTPSEDTLKRDVSPFDQNKGMPQRKREMRPQKKLPLKPLPPMSLSLNQALREGRPLVIIIRGLPGSGKTCAGKLLQAEFIDKDLNVKFFCLDEYFMEEEMTEVIENGKTIFRKGSKYKWISQTQEDDYIGQMFQAFRLTFSSNSHDVIIVDAINNSKDHIDMYKDMVENHAHLEGTVLILEMKEMDPAKCFHLCKHNRSLQDIIRLKTVWYRINRDRLWNCEFKKYDYRFLNWDPNRPSDHFLGENQYIESMEKWQETCHQINRENERMREEDQFEEEMTFKRSCPSPQTQEEVVKKPKTSLS